jgi:hypothetical protein
MNILIALNKKIEEFLNDMGGEEYCKGVANREINSIDLTIYAAYKAEMLIFKSESEVYFFDISLNFS